MSQPCLFCDNSSGSREHLWPAWIHDRKDFGPIKMQIGKSETIIRPNPQLKVKTVCGVCNNGWMSDLEAENIPIIGSMLREIAMPLDQEQQKLVAAWSVKTAMMSDSMKGRNAPNKFYTRDECLNLRQSRQIPSRTLIWIGRVDGMHLADVGNDFTFLYPNGERLTSNTVSTIVTGHFVVQVVTVHMDRECANIDAIPCKFGNWDEKLIQIWPIQKPVVQWPPKVSFTNGGPEGIAYLLDRWRLGEQTDIISAGKVPD